MVRYERKHSLSAEHTDWHESGWSDLKVCVIIDDASRMILAGGEFKNINTENSKLVVDQLVERYSWLCPMREFIMDHGVEFGVVIASMKAANGIAISRSTPDGVASSQTWQSKASSDKWKVRGVSAQEGQQGERRRYVFSLSSGLQGYFIN
jgi:hypothetical protein